MSILKETRRKFTARAKSDDTFDDAVKRNVPNFDTSIYGSTGAAPGGTTLTYAPDSASLDLEDLSIGTTFKPTTKAYKLGPVEAIKGDTRHKLKPEVANLIDQSYRGLNGIMVRCLPNEFPEDFPQAITRNPVTGMTLTAHDFRFAGDVSSLVAFGRMKNVVRTILETVFGKTLTKYIEYLTPTKGDVKITNPNRTEMVEGRKVQVDVKGNKIVPIDDTLEQGVL